MMMQAAVLHQFQSPLVIEQVAIPSLHTNQILVQIKACGVCHTDWHVAQGDWPIKSRLPLILGHEGVGMVCQVGKQVDHIKVGDRVGIPWLYHACSHCPYCLSARETLCAKQQNTGYTVNGAFAQYLVADPNYVVHLPNTLSFDDAASIMCAGLTSYKAIKETELRAGQWLVVIGVGGLGHMAIQYAKLMGMQVVALDIIEAKLHLATACQADLVINIAEEDPIAIIQDQLGGADAVIATATNLNILNQATAMLRPGGTLVLVGLPPGSLNIPIIDLVLNRKTIRGSIVGTRLDLQECLALAADHQIKVHYQVYPLVEANDVLQKLSTGQIIGRAILHPDE